MYLYKNLPEKGMFVINITRSILLMIATDGKWWRDVPFGYSIQDGFKRFKIGPFLFASKKRLTK